MREQNPKLAKQSRVLKVSMDNVYDFAVTPEVDKKTAGVSFRFMPDLKQVQKALEVRPLLYSGLHRVLVSLCFTAPLAGHQVDAQPEAGPGGSGGAAHLLCAHGTASPTILVPSRRLVCRLAVGHETPVEVFTMCWECSGSQPCL